MHIVLAAFVLLLLPLSASASTTVSCSLDYHGEETLMLAHAQSDALGGTWKEIGKFKVRTVLAAPANRNPWFVVEVYANAADRDWRIISSQKVPAPFATGHLAVVEPRLGRSLEYECRESK